MPEHNSQSIRSDRISESTIARIAGNILAGAPEQWLYEDKRRQVVIAAVDTARLIAEVVRETRPLPDPEELP